MRGRAATAVAAGLLLAPAPLRAQFDEPVPTPSIYNLERSAIFYAPGAGTVFEAQIAPQLVVGQDLNALLADGTLTAESGWHFARSFSASPMVRLRMYAEASNPVRTPSYLPHVVAQFFWARNTRGDRPLSARIDGPFELLTLQARLSHHSNGQEGCLYTTQLREERATGDGTEVRCTFPDGVRPDPAAINLRDGSFSTNFLRLSAFYRRLRPEGGTGPGADYVRATWYAGAGIETHRSFLVNWIPGRLSDEQAALYGTWRWQLRAGGALRRPRSLDGHYVDLTFEHAPDAGDAVPDWSVAVAYARTFHRYGGWGLYLRFYHGQDFYNLSFAQEITRLHVGLAWTQERFDRIGIPQELIP